MPKTEFDGLPVIEVPDNEEITVAVKPDDMQEPGVGRVSVPMRSLFQEDLVALHGGGAFQKHAAAFDRHGASRVHDGS